MSSTPYYRSRYVRTGVKRATRRRHRDSAMKGAVTGTALGIALVGAIWGLVWYESDPGRLDDRALKVVASEAHETSRADQPGEPKAHSGFKLSFAVQNQSDGDITIPVESKIMKKLTGNKGFIPYSSVASVEKAQLIPAHQQAWLTIDLDIRCPNFTAETANGEVKAPETCFREALEDSDGFTLNDSRGGHKLILPKPELQASYSLR